MLLLRVSPGQKSASTAALPGSVSSFLSSADIVRKLDASPELSSIYKTVVYESTTQRAAASCVYYYYYYLKEREKRKKKTKNKQQPTHYITRDFPSFFVFFFLSLFFFCLILTLRFLTSTVIINNINLFANCPTGGA